MSSKGDLGRRADSNAAADSPSDGYPPEEHNRPAVALDAVGLRPVPPPPVNLHDLEAVWREMGRVSLIRAFSAVQAVDGNTHRNQPQCKS